LKSDSSQGSFVLRLQSYVPPQPVNPVQSARMGHGPKRSQSGVRGHEVDEKKEAKRTRAAQTSPSPWSLIQSTGCKTSSSPCLSGTCRDELVKARLKRKSKEKVYFALDRPLTVSGTGCKFRLKLANAGPVIKDGFGYILLNDRFGLDLGKERRRLSGAARRAKCASAPPGLCGFETAPWKDTRHGLQS
jgi:hypothetical protein